MTEPLYSLRTALLIIAALGFLALLTTLTDRNPMAPHSVSADTLIVASTDSVTLTDCWKKLPRGILLFVNVSKPEQDSLSHAGYICQPEVWVSQWGSTPADSIPHNLRVESDSQ